MEKQTADAATERMALSRVFIKSDGNTHVHLEEIKSAGAQRFLTPNIPLTPGVVM